MDNLLSNSPLSAYPLGLTFDDVLLLPGYTDFALSDIDLSTQLTRKIALRAPFISAPMDTVTEHELAIAIARLGGIGIIHRNLTPSDQAHEVALVRDEKLLVGAAIGTQPGYLERAAALIDAKVDVLVIDSAHGYTKYQIDAITALKQQYPDVGIIAGNIATADAAAALVKAGADGLRVGMGPGAICSTRIVTGMGVPQLTAIQEVRRGVGSSGVPIIADGGINQSGDITKALAAGASTVMLGRLFAATLESCAGTHNLTADQIPERFKSIVNSEQMTYCFKEYRGMGSIGAMKRGAEIGAEDEFHGKSYTKSDTMVAEGVEGLVPCSGGVATFIEQYLGGIRRGMHDVGARTITDLQRTARFVQITQASLSESHPHDLFITNSGGNYNV